MNLRAYKATGTALTTVLKLLRVKLRVTGLEHLTERPTLFKVNHFTRSETVMIPYVLYNRDRRIVRSLATPAVFKGGLGKFLRTVGVMPVNHPRRNQTIVRELMTGKHDWVIYPEGGIVKNRKTLAKGRLHLDRPSRSGPPHTGAAMLALKAEIVKQRYHRAWERSDRERIEHYRRMYGINGPGDLAREGTVVVPVSITYPGMRSGSNAISRLMTRLKGPLDPRFLEELLVEGNIILSRPEVNIHFGEAIEVRDFLDRKTRLARDIVGLFSESKQENVGLRGQAKKLMGTSMRRLYQGMEVNLEHLFCYGLRICEEETVDAGHFRRALFIAATGLRDRDEVRLHPLLLNGISGLVTDQRFDPLEEVIDLACREGVLRVDNGHYVINREVLHALHDFHEIRIQCMTQVIANEIEPVQPAVNAVREALKRESVTLGEDVSRTIHVTDRQRFHDDYARFYREGVSKPAEYGEPFFLEGPDDRVGVLLVHGYLACPEQMRPMGDALHAAGCTVYGVRLAGHGAVPEALHDVEWREWLRSVHKGYAALETRCRRVFLAGFSLGGLLALLMAAGEARRVDGVVSINAPLRLRDPRARLVPMIVRAVSALRRLRLTDWRAYRTHRSESPELSYERDYLGGVREVRRAIAASRRHLGRVESPTLIIQSRRDPIIAASSARLIERRVGRDRCEINELPCDHHLVVRGEGSEVVFARVLEFIGRLSGRTALTADELDDLEEVGIGEDPPDRQTDDVPEEHREALR